MTENDYARLAYLVLLLLAVGGYFLVANRDRLGKLMQALAAWGLIFVGVIAGLGLWEDIRHDVIPRQAVFEGGRVEVPVAADGHYYLVLELDGTPVRFVLDTGASDMVLAAADARRIGIDPDGLAFTGIARTANGTVATAPVRIGSVRLGGVEDRNVRARVNGGELDQSLLGMGYLSRFDRVEISGGRLVLTR